MSDRYAELRRRYLQMDRDVSAALGLDPMGDAGFPDREIVEDGPVGFLGDCPVPVVESDGLVQEAAADMMAAHRDRLERELEAAWRAGYPYLYVVTDTRPTAVGARIFLPSYHERMPHEPYYRVERYDLESVSDTAVQRVLNNE